MAYAVWPSAGIHRALYDVPCSGGTTMGHMGADDALLALLRYAPLLFVFAGVLVVVWLARQPLPGDIQPDVLAALSETEALTPGVIRQRPPLAHQNIDLKLLEIALEHLCLAGQAVRWYETVGAERQVVYRRVGAPN
jgi:hypothetical protein